ncbi:MAG: IS3 family transposase [Pyrinomonadaceae bacterium]|nr:IS3 family transposase [Pyrinomonadaceae bacterium]
MSLQGDLSVERMCQLAQVSRASFYRSLQQQEPDQEEMEVRAAIQQIFLEHKRRYGYRRISKELQRQGMVVNRKRVQRLMQTDNLLALQRRAYVVTTDSNHDFEVYLNLAKRLKLTDINQLWVADITYIRLQKEFVYLAVILDAFSRKVVGWALDRSLAASLPKAALEMAIAARQPRPGLVHHSDRGVQYASAEYIAVLQQHGIVPSMSRPANPYDNASCESFMKTLKQEEIYLYEYRDLEHLRGHVADFMEQYYNRRRLHSSLSYQTPEEFEQTLPPSSSNAAAKMSFFRHEEVSRSDDLNIQRGSNLPITPQTIGVDESPTGYSLVSCSPAELTSASPVKLDSGEQ